MDDFYDIVTIGGGLGGASLAKVMAEHGRRVLVIERERRFADRIRGEYIAPWGVEEAQRIGLEKSLRETCAAEVPFFEIPGIGQRRDLRLTTPQRISALSFQHPEMQEVVLSAAQKAGAEIWRGVAVREVRPGSSTRRVRRSGWSASGTACSAGGWRRWTQFHGETVGRIRGSEG